MDVGPDQLAWEYLFVCIPIVVIGAPCGALLGSHFHRLVLASFVYILDTAALIAAFALIHQTPVLAGVSVALIVGGLCFFLLITFLGQKLIATENLPESHITRCQTSPYLQMENEESLSNGTLNTDRRYTGDNIRTNENLDGSFGKTNFAFRLDDKIEETRL